MFTKYNSVEIPQNYSGNRFKNLGETEMKTHRAALTSVQQSPVKSSTSPTFQEVIDKTMNDVEEVEADSLDISSESELSYTPQQLDETPNTAKDTSTNEFSLAGFVDKISKDDLLLIALIILFASDSSVSSYDTVIILALLLLYH